MIAGPSSTATPEAKAALRKLVRALPETFRADAAAAASAIVLDPAGWGGTVVPRPEHLDVLQQAVVEGRQVRLAYADRTRSETERTVHPLGLVQKGVAWYLVADTEAGMRTFRVNRVRGATVTDDPVERPPGFDLANEWQAVVETIEAKRTVARAVVRVPDWAVRGLRAQFGTAVDVRRHLADGRVEVELGAPTRTSFAEQLAGWGDHLEVIEPEDVRTRLAEIGAALVGRYGSPRP